MKSNVLKSNGRHSNDINDPKKYKRVAVIEER